MQPLLLYTTFPDLQAAETAIRALLDERLIACANITDGMHALYRWQGQIVKETEVAVWLKTTSTAEHMLMKRLKTLHPYDTPCILSLHPSQIDAEYMAWLARETASDAPTPPIHL